MAFTHAEKEIAYEVDGMDFVTGLSFFRHSVEFAFTIILPDPLSALANKAIQSSTSMTQADPIHPHCQSQSLNVFLLLMNNTLERHTAQIIKTLVTIWSGK